MAERSTKRSAAVTSLIVAVTGFVSVATTYLGMRAHNERPEDPPRTTSQPAPSSPTPQPEPSDVKPLIPEIPSDLSSCEAQIRWLRGQTDRLFREHEARIVQTETDSCAMRSDVHDTRAVVLEKVEATKRGGAVRNDFESHTPEWLDCSPIDPGKKHEPLKPLQRAAEAALRSVQQQR